MRVVHAFRLPIIAAATALGLAGCMHTTGPVATAQPRSDLDYMAYGQPDNSTPHVIVPSSDAGNGGAPSPR